VRINANHAVAHNQPVLKVPPSQLAARLAACNRTGIIRGEQCPPAAVTRIDRLRPDVFTRHLETDRDVVDVHAPAATKPAPALDDARKPYAPPPLAEMPRSDDPPPPPQQVTHLDNYQQVTNRGSLIDELV